MRIGTLDGVQIDDVAVNGPGGGMPSLTVVNLLAGTQADALVASCSPGGEVIIGWSIAGAGPTATVFGNVMLSDPYRTTSLIADPSGQGTSSHMVPVDATGVSIWFHALDVSSGAWTNPIATVIG